jgi:hypothetical protein
MPENDESVQPLQFYTNSAVLQAGAPSRNFGLSLYTQPCRVKLRAAKGVVAWSLRATANGFTPTPIEDMTQGEYDYGLLGDGQEVIFSTGPPSNTTASIQVACASKAGHAIVDCEMTTSYNRTS